MAKKTLIIDDLNGETGAHTRRFAIDGAEYEIDLTDASFAELRRVLKPYLKAARHVGGRPVRPAGRPASTARASRGDSQSATIRSWARSAGIAVPERGRIPATVRAQWLEAGSPQ